MSASIDEHANGTDQQQPPAADAVNEHDRDDRHHDVGDRGDGRREEGVVLGEADGLPQRGRVVEDHVDAHELLEHRQDDARPHDGLEAKARPPQVAQRSALARCRATALMSAILPAMSASPVSPGRMSRPPRSPVLADEVARRLGKPQRDDAVDDGGDHVDDEHPPPRLESEPQVLRRAAGRGREHLVAEQRGEDAEHDGELLQRAEPAAERRGRDLGDVRGGDDRGRANREAADDAPHDEVATRRTRGQSRSRRRRTGSRR